MDAIGNKKDALRMDCLIHSDSELDNGRGDAALGGSKSGESGGYKIGNANGGDITRRFEKMMAIIAGVSKRISDVSERACAADAKISDVSAKVYRFAMGLEQVDRHIRNI